MRPLNYREHLFVNYYLGESKGNASEAARRAGYGSTKHSTEVLGSRLLKKVEIKARIAAKVQEAGLGADEVLARLAAIASVDLKDFMKFGPNGEVTVDIDGARKRGKTNLVKKFYYNNNGPVVEFHDALQALDKLARYHKLIGNEENRAPSVERENVNEELQSPPGFEPEREDLSRFEPDA